MTDSVDVRFMRRALRLARRGWGHTAPNPLVGAVVVRDGVVVGVGWHRRYGGPHAEVEALRACGPAARGASMYVTLEPCNHHGNTPPCSEAIISAGIRRVVIATEDPHPVAAGGVARLRAAGIEVTLGVEGAAARELNAGFLHDVRGATTPWVTLKLALSLDGAIADVTRANGWLTNARSRRHVHHLRAGADAVAVGVRTALADDPLLTVRDVPPPRVAPARVVFDRAARLPLESRLVRTVHEAPVIVVCQDANVPSARALVAAGVTVLSAPSLGAALGALRARHAVRSLFVEGGAGIASALWDDDLIDRLIILQAPVILGGDALSAFGRARPTRVGAARRLPVVGRRALDDDVMTTYAVHAAGGP